MNSSDSEGFRAGRSLAALMELVARLRAPDGCPWDRKQTNLSSAPYLLEEAYEALEAVESQDPREACAELGDLLFQVLFQAQLYAEAGLFDLADVMDQVRAKMVRRHPHVFGEQKVGKAEEVRDLWGEIKKKEREQNGQGLMDSLPKGAPALLRARRIGQRAAKVGFDWQNPKQVWQKVLEEMEELDQASSPDRREQELGDLLFAWAQWARHQEIDPEGALRETNRRFLRRFKFMEQNAASQGKDLYQLDDSELDSLWEKAKAAEKNGGLAGSSRNS